MRVRAIVLLMLAAVLSACQTSAPRPITQTMRQSLRVDTPVTADNLTVWLVRGPDRSGGKAYLTLAEAMEQEKLIVHETGEVNQLTVENVGEQLVFIPAGSIVKGGKQDRTLGTDLIVAKADGKMPIDAFCVEQGRWAARASDMTGEVFNDAPSFNLSSHLVAGKEMKLASNAATSKASQGEVWDSVSNLQAKMDTASGSLFGASGGSVQQTESASSFQLSMESDTAKKLTEGRRARLVDAPKNRRDVVGYVYAINDQIAGGNVYASPELFQKLWPMLLDAAVVESITEGPTTRRAAPPTAKQVLAALGDRKNLTTTRQPNARTNVKAYEAADSILLDTTDADGTFMCRSLLVKPQQP